MGYNQDTQRIIERLKGLGLEETTQRLLAGTSDIVTLSVQSSDGRGRERIRHLLYSLFKAADISDKYTIRLSVMATFMTIEPTPVTEAMEFTPNDVATVVEATDPGTESETLQTEAEEDREKLWEILDK